MGAGSRLLRISHKTSAMITNHRLSIFSMLVAQTNQQTVEKSRSCVT